MVIRCSHSDVFLGPDWCNETCENLRTILRPGDSKTWKDTRIYSIPEVHGNFTKNPAKGGVWGTDIVYLGPSNRDIKFSNANVVGAKSLEYCVGSFGLANSKLSGVEETPSPLQKTRETIPIPSLSFGYTAGSFRRNIFGSLVIGGYDAARFDPATSLSVTFPDNHHTLAVYLSSIHISGPNKTNVGDQPNFTGGLYRLDSTVPQIWLRIKACKFFERTFRLVWNETLEMYLVQLLQDNLKSLSSGAYVGISVGAIFVTLSAVALLAWKKKWGIFRHKTLLYKQDPYSKPEMDGDDKKRIGAMGMERFELETVEALGVRRVELETVEPSQEVFASDVLRPVMPGIDSLHELPGSEIRGSMGENP
ncbi:hypothetical protein P280DRAFT_530352 [Massarina eburnea CBS 473.64]|uniref:Acid protease n=1 Tax=Massarina eburnea CBS 473.64 TaxID=1395130 RepID=A0A6A6RRQ0_9PLEO|nr:hypothetical protein P280DRAFT_530352 [Massarina eburnea CBS 473.64]